MIFLVSLIFLKRTLLYQSFSNIGKFNKNFYMMRSSSSLY